MFREGCRIPWPNSAPVPFHEPHTNNPFKSLLKNLNYYHNNRTVPVTFQLPLQFSQVFDEVFKLDLGSQKEILWFRQGENALFCSCFLKSMVKKSTLHFPMVTFSWNSKASFLECWNKHRSHAPLLLLSLDGLLWSAFVSFTISFRSHWHLDWLRHRLGSIVPHESKRKLSGMSWSWTRYGHGKGHRRNTWKHLNWKSLFELHMVAIS